MAAPQLASRANAAAGVTRTRQRRNAREEESQQQKQQRQLPQRQRRPQRCQRHRRLLPLASSSLFGGCGTSYSELSRRLLFCVAIVLTLLQRRMALAFQLDVPGGGFRCMTENILGPAWLVFRAVAAPNSVPMAPGDANGMQQSPIKVDVTGPSGKKVFQRQLWFETEETMKADGYKGRFPIRPDQPGQYEICFINPKAYSGTHRAEINLHHDRRGPAAGAMAAAPRDSRVVETPAPGEIDDDGVGGTPLQRLMRRAELTAAVLSDEMSHRLAREERLATAAEVTSARVGFLAWFSMVLLLVVSVWQVMYLRRFFKTKKVL